MESKIELGDSVMPTMRIIRRSVEDSVWSSTKISIIRFVWSSVRRLSMWGTISRITWPS